jgi:hypothetical protein
MRPDCPRCNGVCRVKDYRDHAGWRPTCWSRCFRSTPERTRRRYAATP